MYAVLAGGVGAARFLRGLVRVVDDRDVVVVGNVGDDIEVYGLHVSPDLDSITYWLADLIDPSRQWGRADERFVVAEELERFGEDRWFALGDRDLATHIFRTKRLRAGAALSEVTAEITAAFGLRLSLLPATDDPVETRIETTDGRDLHFQEYWVRERAEPQVARVRLAGAEDARPAPRVVESLLDADAILLCPSNPIVSIGTILSVPGMREAIRTSPAPVVGVSPIVGGRVVRGMADRLLAAHGVEVSALGVAQHYGDLLDGWVIDHADRELASEVARLGLEVEVTDTLMDDPAVAARLAATVLSVAERCR